MRSFSLTINWGRKNCNSGLCSMIRISNWRFGGVSTSSSHYRKTANLMEPTDTATYFGEYIRPSITRLMFVLQEKTSSIRTDLTTCNYLICNKKQQQGRRRSGAKHARASATKLPSREPAVTMRPRWSTVTYATSSSSPSTASDNPTSTASPASAARRKNATPIKATGLKFGSASSGSKCITSGIFASSV